MKLRVGFSRTNTFLSKAIRWFTNSPISHTYIRLDDEFLGNPLIIHADLPGVVIVHASLFDKNNDVFCEYEIENESLDRALKKNLSLLGKKYNYWHLLDWAWFITFKRWVQKKIENPTEDPKKIICVDFVLRVLNCAKLTHLEIGSMTPKNLMEWIENHYKELGWKKY